MTGMDNTVQINILLSSFFMSRQKSIGMIDKNTNYRSVKVFVVIDTNTTRNFRKIF